MKKFILTTLTATALMGTTVFANIANFADFNTDFGYGKVSGHWGENEITVLYDNGGINGTPQDDGSLRINPNKEVTAAEFLAMIFQATGTEIKQHEGLSWVENMYQNAVDMGLVIYEENQYLFKGFTGMGGELVDRAGYFTRYNAANIMVMLDTLQGGTMESSRNRSDLDFWSHTAELRGLVADSSIDGFRGDDSLTRTEASALINRLMLFTSRIDTSVKMNQRPNYESYEEIFAPEGTAAEIITSLDNRNIVSRNRSQSTELVTQDIFPQEGDMFNGKLITMDPWTGVLAFGEGQTGGIWAAPEGSGKKWLSTNNTSPYISGIKINPDYYKYAGSNLISSKGYMYLGTEWQAIMDRAVEYFTLNNPDAAYATGVNYYLDIYGNQVTKESEKAVFAKEGTINWILSEGFKSLN